MKNHNKLIIFDLFGVLFSKGLASSKPALSILFGRSQERVASAYKKGEDDFDLGLINNKIFWDNINQDLDTNIKPEIAVKKVLSSYTLNKNVLSLIRRVRKSCKVVACTNYRKEWLDEINKKHQIYKEFDNIYISSEIGILKPSQRIFKLISEKENISLNNTMLIDDSGINCNGATHSGANGYQFRNIFETELAINSFFNCTIPYDCKYSGIILFSDHDDLILQQRSNQKGIANPGKVSVFGGRAKKNETPLDCAIRELQEETGLKVDRKKFHRSSTLSCPIEDEKWMKCYYFVVSAVKENDITVYEGDGIIILNQKNIQHNTNITEITSLALKLHTESESSG